MRVDRNPWIHRTPSRCLALLWRYLQEKTQLIKSLEQVVGMYGELKTQYERLHVSHRRLMQEHNEILASAAHAGSADVVRLPSCKTQGGARGGLLRESQCRWLHRTTSCLSTVRTTGLRKKS